MQAVCYLLSNTAPRKLEKWSFINVYEHNRVGEVNNTSGVKLSAFSTSMILTPL